MFRPCSVVPWLSDLFKNAEVTTGEENAGGQASSPGTNQGIQAPNRPGQSMIGALGQTPQAGQVPAGFTAPNGLKPNPGLVAFARPFYTFGPALDLPVEFGPKPQSCSDQPDWVPEYPD